MGKSLYNNEKCSKVAASGSNRFLLIGGFQRLGILCQRSQRRNFSLHTGCIRQPLMSLSVFLNSIILTGSNSHFFKGVGIKVSSVKKWGERDERKKKEITAESGK